MSVKNTPEERMLIALIRNLAVTEEEKAAWVEQIQTNGMSQELATQIHEKIAAPVEHDPNPANHARLLLDFSRLVNRWRMTTQKKNFKR